MSALETTRRLCLSALAVFVVSVSIVGFPHQSTYNPASAFPQRYAEASADRHGFLIDLIVQNGTTRLVSAAEIDNYLEGKRPSADDDWLMLLFTGAGDCIGTKRIDNPGHFSPVLSADQAIPLTVKVPHLSELALVAIFDQYRREQIQIPIDDSFKAQASASRRRFLAHDRENRRLLMESAGMRPRQAAELETPHSLGIRSFEDLPGEVQRIVQEEIAVEAEQLEQRGPKAMNLRKALSLEPSEIEPDPVQIKGHRTAQNDPALGTCLLSGQVTDVDTGALLAGARLDFYQYDASNRLQAFLGTQTTGASGNYSISVDPGYVDIRPDYSRVLWNRYVKKNEHPQIDGNTIWNIRAIPGVLLSGQMTNGQSQPVAGVALTAYSSELRLSLGATTSSTGTYSLVVPIHLSLRITLSAPFPYVAPPLETGVILTADTDRDYILESGWAVSGTVRNSDGAAVSKASVLLRQLCASTTTTPYWYASSDGNGRYAIAVPKNLEPVSFVISAYASPYLSQSAGLTIEGDITQDFRLESGYTVSGTVRDASGKPIPNVRVRAYRDNAFVTSALTGSTGAYALDVAGGVYDIEALPGTTFAPVLASNVAVGEPITEDFVLFPAAGILTVKVYFQDEDSYARYSGRSARFELFQSGVTAYAGNSVLGPGGLDQARGMYFRPYTTYTKDGRYTLVTYLPGYRPITLPNIDVAGPTAVSIDAPAPFLWRGVLRGGDGKPLPNMSVVSYNDTTTTSSPAVTNSSGEFTVFLTPNGFVKFYSNEASNNILHTERIGNVDAGRQADCVLDTFPHFEDAGETLAQMYGVADRNSRWNIVMIGDGYTRVTETYTDLNGNGRWDGVLYYDLNKNGVFDTGEPYQRYGNAPAPVAGKDPKLQNEPFTDLNNDEYPNLRDQELYDQNTLDTARSLFGQDEWRLHRDAFNIFRIRVISNQAGHDIRDSNNNDFISRDTALGTFLDTPSRGYLFNGNTGLISQYINQYVPEVNTRIVLVNQPVRMGRANSYIFQYGGEISGLCNDYTIAHEMGHNVGLLSDEYTEYQETYKGPESASRNVTALTDPTQIPWKHLLTPGKEIPSLPGSGGVGLFEGAGYYTGGRYRPTAHCMMVSGNRYCPVCTEEIEIRLRDIMGVVPSTNPLGPTGTVFSLYPQFLWDVPPGVSHFLLELEKDDGSQLVASFDIYDKRFTLPFALAEGTGYRWRIRPGSGSTWGAWSPWAYFRPQSNPSAFTAIFAQIAAGGLFRTTLIGMNAGESAANVLPSLIRSDGTPFDPTTGPPVGLRINPMGLARLETSHVGDVVSGYALFKSDNRIDGTALFKTVSDNRVLSEAAVGLSKPAKNFIVYIDNQNYAYSGYAVANPGGTSANLTMTLRDASGNLQDTTSVSISPGRHFAEFAFERFRTKASPGFEGSIEFGSDQDLAGVALRFDNPDSDVFSTIPALADEAATTLYFPQVADGGEYRTNFILVNPTAGATLAKIEFFSSDGTPMEFPISGAAKSSYEVFIGARGVARFITDGISTEEVNVGWAKVTCPVAIGGSAIFQTISATGILSEAGVASSPPTPHFMTYVETLGSAESGLAICNPNPSGVTLTMNLRQSSGEVAATTDISLPANGHVAKIFSEWFPRGFTEFEGTLEVLATAPVSAVGLRYDNPQHDVFASLPIVTVPGTPHP